MMDAWNLLQLSNPIIWTVRTTVQFWWEQYTYLQVVHDISIVHNISMIVENFWKGFLQSYWYANKRI